MRRTGGKARRRVGANIKRVRKLSGWSQEALAEQIDKSGKEVGRIERGEVAVDVDVLESLAIAMKCDIADLVKPGSNGHPRAAPFLIREQDLAHFEGGFQIAERTRRYGRL